MGIEKLNKRNTGEWTKGRQKHKHRRKEESPPCEAELGDPGNSKVVNPTQVLQGRSWWGLNEFPVLMLWVVCNGHYMLAVACLHDL